MEKPGICDAGCRYGGHHRNGISSVAVVTTVMAYLPSLEVLAAPIMKEMAHLKSGSGNANAHFGGATPEAFILSDNTDVTGEDFSFTLKVGSTKDDTRFRFVNKYVDDNNWSFIAYDGMSNNWFTTGLSSMRQTGQVHIPDCQGFRP